MSAASNKAGATLVGVRARRSPTWAIVPQPRPLHALVGAQRSCSRRRCAHHDHRPTAARIRATRRVSGAQAPTWGGADKQLGWRRLGRALGRLAEPLSRVEQLPVLDRQRFGTEHAQRLRELGDRVAAIAAAVPDWPALASAEIPRPGPLVLTHGDPGLGNFLDDGHDGWLIDCEDAHVAPRGLDLARLVFIAWLGSGPAGFVGCDHDGRARGRQSPATWRRCTADGSQASRRRDGGSRSPACSSSITAGSPEGVPDRGRRRRAYCSTPSWTAPPGHERAARDGRPLHESPAPSHGCRSVDAGPESSSSSSGHRVGDEGGPAATAVLGRARFGPSS